MKIQANVQRQRRLTLTSLIDVIFLLLLFFMLSSTFTKFAEVEIFNSGSGQVSQPSAQNPVFISLKPESILVNGIETGLPLLKPTVMLAASGSQSSVLINLVGAISSQRLVDILHALSGQQFNVQFLNSEQRVK